ncbi:RrF2 family transcriptional regulator [Aestuariivivens sediminicola]|uniref:RrF2 family transcriptional regulator n=1 Tax=Aestuariivivens sediminicola TaxID=2913560 RepID=UPI001F590F11|nr:Rrf2 family transcriptional regulator [Aestuariivivens sediminicola]
MFTNSVKYALKAVLFLAVHSGEDRKIMVKDIAEPINVPKAYIAKLLQELSKQEIISSTRGVKGGFYLTESNLKQPVLNVIYAIDGTYRMNSCLLSLESCNEYKPCPLHHIVSPMRSKLIESLKEKTLEDLSIEIQSGLSYLPL